MDSDFKSNILMPTVKRILSLYLSLSSSEGSYTIKDIFKYSKSNGVLMNRLDGRYILNIEDGSFTNSGKYSRRGSTELNMLVGDDLLDVISEVCNDFKDNHILIPLNEAVAIVMASFIYIQVIGTSIVPITTNNQQFSRLRKWILKTYRIKYGVDEIIEIINNNINILLSIKISHTINYSMSKTYRKVMDSVIIDNNLTREQINSLNDVLSCFITSKAHLPIGFDDSISYGILKVWSRNNMIIIPK